MVKIFINPGHAPNGKPDPGASNPNTGLRECDVALAVGNMVAEYLQNVGYEVQVLQSNSLSEICDAANSWPADLFISIHCNAFNTAAKGTETCVFSSFGARLEYASPCSKKLGEYIQSQIVKSLGTVDRGLKPRTPGVNGLYVLTNTDMPAVLSELAFIDNDEDAALLTNHQDDFAAAIARGVTDWLSF
ncbi:N-acetylmuramoyl-L-alanine amidase LytC [Sporomusa rhizae]|uniref:N-acetylmuramoyl-L-alanine amidase family protein n=1 Tax=Sporomusa rhizae TaxID=357999 RepID=UPI00352B7863